LISSESETPLALFILFAVAFFASVFYFAPFLSERLATHFSGSGQPNGWMTRRQHISFITILGLGVPAFVVAACYVIQMAKLRCSKPALFFLRSRGAAIRARLPTPRRLHF
jgi:uncharacterized membrane protein